MGGVPCLGGVAGGTSGTVGSTVGGAFSLGGVAGGVVGNEGRTSFLRKKVALPEFLIVTPFNDGIVGKSECGITPSYFAWDGSQFYAETNVFVTKSGKPQKFGIFNINSPK